MRYYKINTYFVFLKGQQWLFSLALCTEQNFCVFLYAQQKKLVLDFSQNKKA